LAVLAEASATSVATDACKQRSLYFFPASGIAGRDRRRHSGGEELWRDLARSRRSSATSLATAVARHDLRIRRPSRHMSPSAPSSDAPHQVSEATYRRARRST
jgi:hypothetical protein